ncbi:hypothetical protein SPI_03469 [Niveomyces insectorum RCEF 264]|uniref:Uncharacterized protein n=1 Tax=Niveomyces insectorum RCEF 264 TaxID=1081102 RepID=A0A167W3V1_9HYPO|nr:hypothetical protein SPI_03469 [Niveomyces insectorum RCEF 264]
MHKACVVKRRHHHHHHHHHNLVMQHTREFLGHMCGLDAPPGFTNPPVPAAPAASSAEPDQSNFANLNLQASVRQLYRDNADTIHAASNAAAPFVRGPLAPAVFVVLVAVAVSALVSLIRSIVQLLAIAALAYVVLPSVVNKKRSKEPPGVDTASYAATNIGVIAGVGRGAGADALSITQAKAGWHRGRDQQRQPSTKKAAGLQWLG